MADTPTTLKTLDGFEIAPGEQAWAFGVAYAGGAVTLVGVTGSETSAHDGSVTWWGEWTDDNGNKKTFYELTCRQFNPFDNENDRHRNKANRNTAASNADNNDDLPF